jgi:hypothetical protein
MAFTEFTLLLDFDTFPRKSRKLSPLRSCCRSGSSAWGVHINLVVLAAVSLVGMIVSIAWARETKHLTLNEASAV